MRNCCLSDVSIGVLWHFGPCLCQVSVFGSLSTAGFLSNRDYDVDMRCQAAVGALTTRVGNCPIAEHEHQKLKAWWLK